MMTINASLYLLNGLSNKKRIVSVVSKIGDKHE
jgi:hypothetical protein